MRQHTAALKRKSRQILEELEHDRKVLESLLEKEAEEVTVRTARKEQARADAAWMKEVFVFENIFSNFKKMIARGGALWGEVFFIISINVLKNEITLGISEKLPLNEFSKKMVASRMIRNEMIASGDFD